MESESVGELFLMREGDNRVCNDLRLSQQPVPLAFHKHDGGERPGWVKDGDWILTTSQYHRESFCVDDAGSLLDWGLEFSFAVIKPVLPE